MSKHTNETKKSGARHTSASIPAQNGKHTGGKRTIAAPQSDSSSHVSQDAKQATLHSHPRTAIPKVTAESASAQERRQAAILLLRSWREEGDETEQRETFEALRAGLNRHHSSRRRIYP
jgi:hypothetical protein